MAELFQSSRPVERREKAEEIKRREREREHQRTLQCNTSHQLPIRLAALGRIPNGGPRKMSSLDTVARNGKAIVLRKDLLFLLPCLQACGELEIRSCGRHFGPSGDGEIEAIPTKLLPEPLLCSG